MADQELANLDVVFEDRHDREHLLGLTYTLANTLRLDSVDRCDDPLGPAATMGVVLPQPVMIRESLTALRSRLPKGSLARDLTAEARLHFLTTTQRPFLPPRLLSSVNGAQNGLFYATLRVEIACTS